MTALRHERAVGDTLSLFAVQLTRSGTPVNLTGRTVKFNMVSEAGNIVVASTTTGVSVSDATNGLVEYDFSGAAVAAAGTYYGFFVVEDNSGEPDTYPEDGVGIEIIIFKRDADRRPASPLTIDIVGAANSPIRTRTAEGTVEERSVTELIKADQYLANKSAGDLPGFGIRVAQTRPPGMTGRGQRGTF